MSASTEACSSTGRTYSAKAIAQIQARGMQIDTVLWNLVQDNKDRSSIIRDLQTRFDPSYGTANPDLCIGRTIELRSGSSNWLAALD